jgi:hypothetical protein
MPLNATERESGPVIRLGADSGVGLVHSSDETRSTH